MYRNMLVVKFNFLLCCVVVLGVSCDSNLTDIYIAGLFPMEGWWPGGAALRIATDMALEHINARLDMLPGYRLNMEWANTKVSLKTVSL